jgi:dephospho-CoA kinase
MTVIGTVGLPGSGKGEFASVAREAGVPVVTMGDVIREECRNRGLDPEQHHGRIAKQLREEKGEDAIAEESLPHVREALEDSDVVLVDGLRSGVEADRFEETFGEEFVLVSVEAPFEVRAKRLRDRARDDSDLDDESLRERERRELAFGMDEAIDRADRRIDNTDSLEAYRRRARSILVEAGATVEIENGPEAGAGN